MKAGDIVGLSANRLIQGATLDKCSHVAIALNDKMVIEILPNGLRKVSLGKCIEDCRSAALYERPPQLGSLSEDILQNEYQRMHELLTKYSFPRMLYSGFIPVARNGFYVAALISLVLIYRHQAPEYTPITILLLLYSPLVYAIQRFCSRKHRLKRFRIPDFLIKDLPGEFCSSLVVDLDTKANGALSSKINKNHEPRPKDVIQACLDLGYIQKTIKSNKSSQKDALNCTSA